MSTSSDHIPILNLGAGIAAQRAEIDRAIARVVESGAFINGPDVKRFEDNMCAKINVKHCVGLNSGTDALVIGLRALGVKEGDEVIVPGFTFFATAECVSAIGAVPVFVDVDPETLTISPEAIQAAVTPKTKAVIPVHLYGLAADMDAIQAIAKQHDLKVFEDVAQAQGGTYKGRQLGSIGDAGAFSFFPSKNLGAFGDGGLLSTNDPKVAEMCRILRQHGGVDKYNNLYIGYNSRLDTVQAAILGVKLSHLDKAVAGRRAAAKVYNELLSGVSGVRLPKSLANPEHSFHQYTVRIEGGRRDQVKDALAAKGIQTMVYYPIPIHRLPVYRDKTQHLALKHSEDACLEVLSLPIWPEIAKETQVKVVNALRESTNT